MKSFESRNTVALRKRVKKVHAKARFVGVLYLLGTLAIALLACLPMLKIDGQELSVTTFLPSIMALIQGDGELLPAITSILYLIIFFFSCIINFFKCFCKLGWLFRRSEKYVNGYNRNMRAMEKMGIYFSRAFSAMINGYLLIYVLQPVESNVTLAGMYPYAVLAVGVAIHFLAGLIGGTVSFFNVGGPNSDVEEEPRRISLFVYFFRNLIQIAATAVIIYFFIEVSVIGNLVNTLLTGGNPLAGDLIKDVVPVALQLLTLIWIFVLVKHATNITEYNRFGIDGKGMKNYRVFSFFTALTSIILFVLSYKDVKYLTMAGVAFFAFLVDCICKTRSEDDRDIVEEEEEDYIAPKPKAHAPSKEDMPLQRAPQPYPAMPIPTQAPNQPIYIPIYYPMPMPQAAPAPRQCTPSCAPMPQTPPCMPAPCAQMAPMPPRPFGMPPAMPAPAPAPCAMSSCAPAPCAMPAPCGMHAPAPAPAPAIRPTVAPIAPVEVPTSTPIASISEDKSAAPMVRPEPSPAPAHLQADAPAETEQPKTKKQLREEKKEEKARAKFLKQSEKNAKKAAKLEKKMAKAEKKQAKKEQKLLKKTKKLPQAPVETKVETPVETPVETTVKLGPDGRPVPQPHPSLVNSNVQEGIPFDTDPREVDMPLNPKKQFKIRCPQCGKELMVRETSPYHRCPSCDKVFSLRKFETYVKKS